MLEKNMHFLCDLWSLIQQITFMVIIFFWLRWLSVCFFFYFFVFKMRFRFDELCFFIIQLSYFLPPLETTKFLRKYSENIKRVRKELPKEYLSWAVVISCMCIVCCVSLCQWYMHAMWWNCRLYFFYWHRESIVSTLIPTTKTAYKQQKDIDL